MSSGKMEEGWYVYVWNTYAFIQILVNPDSGLSVEEQSPLAENSVSQET